MTEEKGIEKKGLITSSHYGPFQFVNIEEAFDSSGKKVELEKVASICRCGKSKYKPNCDGSHCNEAFANEKDDDRISDKVKDYVGENIIIHDNRGICCHDGSCTKFLPEVFKMNERPWIDPDGASPGKIIEVIQKCPSGALSFTLGTKRYKEFGQKTEKVIFIEEGPIQVEGGIEFLDYSGSAPECSEHYTLCRCSKSKNKPFCDGSHDN
ncbi:MAG: CDGSH iron-sulfur domain-containing protein [Desulforegulaceae bacterium]|nr:CDGSH iron-sulfur domain-containing protein [Desulforegulaceae bacterium]